MNTSLRNWQKARLAGFCLDKSLLTEAEKYHYDMLLVHKKQLLNYWDNHTEVLIGHDLPPHKCSLCGRRGTKKYLIKGVNYCYGHSKTIGL